MNPQQEAVAIWQFIESRGKKPTHRAIATMLRSWGVKFKDSDLVSWIAPFRAVSGKQPRNKKQAQTQRAGSIQETASRVNKVPLASKRVVVTPLLLLSQSFVQFDDLEPDVETYIANAAAENKTGKIAESRVAALRRDLAAVLGELGGDREAFAHGLRIANAKGAANRTYVKKAAKSYNPDEAGPHVESGRCGCNKPTPADCRRLHDDTGSTSMLPRACDLPNAYAWESSPC